MKLNFWQWLGLILLVVAGIFYLAKKENGASNPAATTPAAAPATTQGTR